MYDSISTKHVPPPLKWAGGKRWLTAQNEYFVPKGFNRYFEPFFGSGALFFHLRPARSCISDVNEDLINLYKVIKCSPVDLQALLREHHNLHNKEYYYKVRAMAPDCSVSKAARLLYLNRTCWNGLYRVNKQGRFNVPIGTKSAVCMKTDDFEALSKILANADISARDFEESIDLADEGDFVFADPPYTVAHNNNGFIKYNEALFSWEDQVRLRNAIKRAASRGAICVVTNADHESIHQLYHGFKIRKLSRVGVIAGASVARGKFDELIIQAN